MEADDLRRLEKQVQDTEDRSRAALTAAESAMNKIASHEEICALRYEGIKQKLDKGEERFGRLEKLIVLAMIVVTGGTAAVETLAPMLTGAAP